MPRQNGSVGQVDIARAAGVSLGTVSNTINKPEMVAEATREKVLAVMQRLNFVHNEAAASLRRGTNRLLGLVVPDITNPFYSSVAEGVTDAADSRGYGVVLCNSQDDPTHELKQLQLLGNLRTAGALIVPLTADDSRLKRLRELGTRLVLIDRAAGVREGCSASIDDLLGGRLAGTHLIEGRGSDIALVNGPATIAQCRQRRLGLLEAFSNAGADPGCLREFEFEHMTVDSGREAAKRMLEQGLPRAVFATNDQLALGVIKELTSRGIDVPGNVAVMGYGNLAIAEDAPVPISSIEQPKTELGRAAVEMLLAEIDDADHVHRHSARVFQPRIVLRQSA
jgi:LacI family transcriptional regulator